MPSGITSVQAYVQPVTDRLVPRSAGEQARAKMKTQGRGGYR